MSNFLWFMFGLWIGGTLGFLLFAFLQMSRDASRVADAQWSKLNRDGRAVTGIGNSSKRHPRFRAGEAGC
jgi:hypothetical protein